MDINVTTQPGTKHAGHLQWHGKTYRCALGRSGLTKAKQEGDGATPIGRFPLCEILYRPDRLGSPPTVLKVRPLTPNDGWCDDPADDNYNRPIAHPYPASAEHLWRDDGLYDLVVVIGYNLAPVAPGMGSAIFLHVATDDYGPTEGCVALARADLLEVLADCAPDTHICIG
ncbi:MAG: L,D-transpeptidase family protein [Rhodospirillales bacterium]|nr:L,D-transpeptidase family protein [Rhodospirillales bacterium]